jgi:hypothetical protein
MKFRFAVAGVLWFALAGSFALAEPISFTVDGQANIFAAGHSVIPPSPLGPGGQGVFPFEHIFSPTMGQIVQFMSLAGVTGCRGEAPFIGAEGGFCVGGPGTNVFSLAGISGTVHFGRQMFLAGVFTDGTEPMDPAPPRLDFTSADTFTELSPLLNQTFFIGDGLTGTGAGAQQRFHIPASASRLYLGFVDTVGFGLGGGLSPAAYSDNTGQVTGQFEILGAVPEPGAGLLVSVGLIGITAATRMVRRRKLRISCGR